MQKINYNLEIGKIVKEIKRKKAKLICLQLPDGLKPFATKISSIIEKKTKAKVLIWFGSCFGSCDLPNLEKLKPKIDLLIHFGHDKFKKI